VSNVFDVIAIGVPDTVRLLLAEGITDVVDLPDPAVVTGSTFDDAEHTWSVTSTHCSASRTRCTTSRAGHR
jgi:hypothetical protein